VVKGAVEEEEEKEEEGGVLNESERRICADRDRACINTINTFLVYICCPRPNIKKKKPKR
jgi:hypothetical protein